MFNHVSEIGRIVADPELRKTPQGISVTSFTIAVNNRRKDKEDLTYFLDVVAWQGLAEVICKHFKKGERIGIEGFLRTSQFTDKDGKNRKSTEIVAQNIEFIEPKTSTGDASDTKEQSADTPIADDSDLPF